MWVSSQIRLQPPRNANEAGAEPAGSRPAEAGQRNISGHPVSPQPSTPPGGEDTLTVVVGQPYPHHDRRASRRGLARGQVWHASRGGLPPRSRWEPLTPSAQRLPDRRRLAEHPGSPPTGCLIQCTFRLRPWRLGWRPATRRSTSRSRRLRPRRSGDGEGVADGEGLDYLPGDQFDFVGLDRAVLRGVVGA